MTEEGRSLVAVSSVNEIPHAVAGIILEEFDWVGGLRGKPLVHIPHPNHLHIYVTTDYRTMRDPANAISLREWCAELNCSRRIKECCPALTLEFTMLIRNPESD